MPLPASSYDRFDQPGYAIYKSLKALLLKAANKEEHSAELQHVISTYGNDLNESELSIQLTILSANFDHKDQSKRSSYYKEFLLFLRSLSEGQCIFFTQVCTVAIFNNEENKELLEKRLNDLDQNSIADEFVQGNERKLHVFGKSTNEHMKLHM